MGKRGRGLSFSRRRKKVNIPLLREIALWVFEIAFVIAIAYLFVFFIGTGTRVVGNSMSPNLKDGEKILINKITYMLFDPKPNDVVVFLPNGNEKSHYYVKRVIAVPGDTVQIMDGAIYVNKKLFVDSFDAPAIDDPGIAKEEITIGEDEYFVLGDNRNDSEDSRYANIGCVKKKYMIGKAWFLYSPISHMGLLRMR